MANLTAYDSTYGSGVKVSYSISGRTISWTFYVHTGNTTWQDQSFKWNLKIGGTSQKSSNGDNTFYSSYNTDYSKGSGTYTVSGTAATTVSIAISCEGSYWSAPTASASTSVNIAATAPATQEHTVVFDPVGGTVYPGSKQKVTNRHFYVPIPERFGYTWTGWKSDLSGDTSNVYTCTSSSSGGTEYTHDQDGGVVTMTAQWTGGPYSIHFNANGGTGTMPDQLMRPGVVNNNILTATQQNISEWTKVNPDYVWAESQANGVTALTFLPSASIWEKIYSPAITVTKNVAYTLSFRYHFEQPWSQADDGYGGGKYGAFGINVTTSAQSGNSNATNIVKRAEIPPSVEKGVWNIATCTFTPTTTTIYLSFNGGTIADGIGTRSFFIKDLKLEKADYSSIWGPINLTPNQFTRVGYQFSGWATSASGAVMYKNCEAVSGLAASGATVNLYAIWVPSDNVGKTHTAWVNVSGTWKSGIAKIIV